MEKATEKSPMPSTCIRRPPSHRRWRVSNESRRRGRSPLLSSSVPAPPLLLSSSSFLFSVDSSCDQPGVGCLRSFFRWTAAATSQATSSSSSQRSSNSVTAAAAWRESSSNSCSVQQRLRTTNSSSGEAQRLWKTDLHRSVRVLELRVQGIEELPWKKSIRQAEFV